jgi:uncharacterized protein with ParB-like and HNH nuclease domain
MSKFLNTTNRTIAWFKKANDNNELQMKPPFQRNPVWTPPQKSYLIDSVLNGYPIPEIYMQEYVDENGNEKHTLIDGQQRIRACLEFIEGGFRLKEEDSPTWARMRFDDLSPDDKKKIYSYTYIVRILPEMPDEEIRGIFQRLNKNVVALNPQELRQATYWGPFLQTMQEISNYKYWSTSGVFTPLNIRRMLDVEFISELSIAVLHSHQNKKETIDKYYQEYEEEFEAKDDLINLFQHTLFEIEQIFPDLKNTRWKKKTDFYSLFVYLASKESFLPLSGHKRHHVRDVLDTFSSSVNLFLSTEEANAEYEENVENYSKSIRASSDLGNRKRRHLALVGELDAIITAEDDEPAKKEIAPLQDGLFEAKEQEEG